MMWGPYGFGGFGGMAWMPFPVMFVWLLIFVLGIAAVRAIIAPRHRFMGQWHRPDLPASGRSSGRSTLDDRYARGEINRDEYLQKRQDIIGPVAKG